MYNCIEAEVVVGYDIPMSDIPTTPGPSAVQHVSEADMQNYIDYLDIEVHNANYSTVQVDQLFATPASVVDLNADGIIWI